MANEWTPFPDRGGHDEQDDQPTQPHRRVEQPAPEPVQQPAQPPVQSPAQPTLPPAAAYAPREDTQVITQEPPRRRAGSLTAAVLAGALVLGGAAGVGGAAAYDALNGPDSSSQGTTPDVNASNRNTSNSQPADGSVASVAAKVLPSVVQINVTSQGGNGTGSGIILSKDGMILTNNHVASVAGDNGSMRVDFNDGTSAKATLVGADPVTDLAVIKAEGKDDLTPAEIGKSSDLKVGESVVAVGSPYGLGATVTSGIVSALNRAVSVQTTEQDDQGQGQDDQNPFGFGQQQQQQSSGDQTTTYPAIQTDAAINPGNSGGPLVNGAGQVIGVNSSIRTASSGSSGSIGLGFAIPIDEVLPIVNQLKDGETATHARLGITVGNSTSADQAGALVRQVESGSAGADAGLKNGDIVTKVDDVPVDGADSLVATVRGHRPGDEVTLTVVRDGKTETVKATLGSDEGKTGS